MKILWSAEAKKSLRSIRNFIAQDSEVYATQMVSRVIERAEQAAQHPSRGHPVHEYPEKTLKEIHEHPYRIIYEYNEDELRVITVVHFRQQRKSI